MLVGVAPRRSPANYLLMSSLPIRRGEGGTAVAGSGEGKTCACQLGGGVELSPKLWSTRSRPEDNASPDQEAAEMFSAGFEAGAMGRLTVKTDPLPTSLATSTEP